MEAYELAFQVGLETVEKIKTTQKAAIQTAGELIGQAHRLGHHFYVSGSGHSHTVAEEFYARAGCLAFTIPILTNELTLTEHPTKSTHLERLEGYATILADLYEIGAGDVIVIASNSGRNAYPVELALTCKERGCKVIAITCMDHSLHVESRHSSGKKLYELADVVIDNCGKMGDAATKMEGVDVPILPTSSIANAFIVSAISATVMETLNREGFEVEVFTSNNVDGGDARNEAYFKRYTRMYIQEKRD